MPPPLRAPALAAALACAPPGDPAPSEALAEYNLPLTPSPAALALLAWYAPSQDCPLAYRVRVDETYPPGLEQALSTRAEQSESFLLLGLKARSAKTWPSGPVPPGEVVLGPMVFRGPKTGDRVLTREWAASSSLVGPGSPDAACFERTWDPVEDALALGWPALTGRLTAVGEAWRGAKVESRCNRASCVDPVTRGGGSIAHHRPCTTMSWRERLVGVHQLGDAAVAEIESVWSDNHGVGVGLWSERSAFIDLTRGRLLRAEIFIHHTFSGIERHLVIDAVDACPGGLVAAGWEPPPRTSDAQAELKPALERATSTAR